MYNQKHHKFDTFYNHKFGFHITGPRQDAFEAVFRMKPKVVKTLDFTVDVMKRIRQEIPDVFLVGRLFVHPQDYGQMSGGTAQDARRKGIEMAERILREEVNQDRHHINGKPIFHAWESLNEVFPEWADEHLQHLYDEYQVAFGEKMLTAGFEPIACNFSQGNGRGEPWLRLYQGTLETYNYLGFHEYDWPTMDRLHNVGLNGPVEIENQVPAIGEGRGNDGMWRALRYRRIMFEGIRQKYGDKHTAIITECGMTQGVWSGGDDIGPWADHVTVPATIPGGIVSSPIPEADYWQTLLWYNSEVMKDDYVIGACLFVTGAAGLPEWHTFEHLGGIMSRIAGFQQLSPLERNPTPITPFAQPGVVGTIFKEANHPNTNVASRPTAPTTTTPTQPPNSKPRRERPVPPQPEPIDPRPIAPIKPNANESALPRPVQAVASDEWLYSLTRLPGPTLLAGDIGLHNEIITIVKPNGRQQQLRSGSQPEYGEGGFVVQTDQPGIYQIEFMGEIFHIPLKGQFTQVQFERRTNPEAIQTHLQLRETQSIYQTGEPVPVILTLKNTAALPISYGVLGLLTDTDHFQISRTAGTILAGGTLQHEDHLTFSAPGRYTIQLAICFSSKDNCIGTDKGWKRYEPNLQVMVQ